MLIPYDKFNNLDMIETCGKIEDSSWVAQHTSLLHTVQSQIQLIHSRTRIFVTEQLWQFAIVVKAATFTTMATAKVG